MNPKSDEIVSITIIYLFIFGPHGTSQSGVGIAETQVKDLKYQRPEFRSGRVAGKWK